MNFISNFIKTRKGEYVKSLVIFTNQYVLNLSIFIFIYFLPKVSWKFRILCLLV